MILYKNRLFFGIIKNVIGAVFGVLYKLLAAFNLQFTLLLLLLGAVLFLTGSFENNKLFLTIYQVVLVLSAVHAIIKTIKRLLGIEKKVKRSKGAQILERTANESQESEKAVDQSAQSSVGESQPSTTQASEKPVYFRVRQNPEYVMAEYSNRYELFRIIDGQMKKIRTDYK